MNQPNRIAHSLGMIDKMYQKEEERPNLVEWAMSNKDAVQDILAVDYNALCRALKSRDEWRDFWTQISERIEDVYEDET